jgi:threonine/homoserine/homoserine lactone efflux protein
VITSATGLAFGLACLALILIPGPSVLFVIGRSLALGRRGGLLSVVGNELGVIPLILAVAFGIGALVSASLVVFTVIKVAGAAYLVYLGIQAIRHRHDHNTAGSVAGPQHVPGWRILRQGFLVGVSNPKTIVFLVAILPQFVDPERGRVPWQLIELGLIFVLVALVCDSIWALIAGSARGWFATSPKRLSGMTGAGGGMMIGLSGVLLLTGHKR